MTTRQERADASAQKLKLALDKAAYFSKKVVAPVLICVNVGDKVTPMRITKREIRDQYGREAARAFSRIFRCRQRGGMSKTGESYKSMWVLNYAAVQPLKDWCLANETLPQLEARLIEAGANEEEWDREADQFMAVGLRKLILANRRKARAKYRKSIESAPKRTDEEHARYEALM